MKRVMVDRRLFDTTTNAARPDGDFSSVLCLSLWEPIDQVGDNARLLGLVRLAKRSQPSEQADESGQLLF